ncbi:unnamed protein product [Rhodiola kirilowii]
MAKEEDSDDDMVCLDESFFINDDYQLATFTFGFAYSGALLSAICFK